MLKKNSLIRRGAISAAFFAAIFMANAATAGAFSFEPMSAALEPTGAESVRSFRLKNEGKDRIAIRVTILTRESLEDGSEKNEPVDPGAFIVFPSRFVLEPGTTRSLKVQWKGDVPERRELAFRIVAEQVPVEFQARKGSGISLLFKYVGALYVRPATASKPDLRVVSAVGEEVEGQRGIKLRLKNLGGVHAVLDNFQLTTSHVSDLEAVRHPEEALSGVEGENILAGAERLFFIPFGSARVGESYDARIEYAFDN